MCWCRTVIHVQGTANVQVMSINICFSSLNTGFWTSLFITHMLRYIIIVMAPCGAVVHVYSTVDMYIVSIYIRIINSQARVWTSLYMTDIIDCIWVCGTWMNNTGRIHSFITWHKWTRSHIILNSWNVTVSKVYHIIIMSVRVYMKRIFSVIADCRSSICSQ